MNPQNNYSPFSYSQYYNNEEIGKFFHSVNQHYPELSTVYSIGKSVEGRNVQVIELSRKNSKSKPNVKLIAGVHGDEPVGTQVLLNLVHHLVSNFERDKSVRYLQFLGCT